MCILWSICLHEADISKTLGWISITVCNDENTLTEVPVRYASFQNSEGRLLYFTHVSLFFFIQSTAAYSQNFSRRCGIKVLPIENLLCRFSQSDPYKGKNLKFAPFFEIVTIYYYYYNTCRRSKTRSSIEIYKTKVSTNDYCSILLPKF